MLSTDTDSIDDGGNEIVEGGAIYCITDDIDPFESVFLAEDGNCIAIKKDTTFGYVVVIDQLKNADEKALVVYIDSLSKVRRVFNDGKSIDIEYNGEGSVNLWYRDSEDTGEIFNDIEFTPTKAVTKAGNVFDPMDVFSLLLSLWDIKDIGDAVDVHPIIGDVLKVNILADILTSGPFSNTSTEILTGVTSVAITAIIGTGNIPVATLLAIIGIADAAISEWQDMIADSYFGTAKPVTEEVVQLTDKHFVVSYSITDVDPGKTDFNVGVIVADGKIFEDAMFITKKWHSYKKSIPFDSKDGKIIINLENLSKKKGDKLKYRIYLEPADDNGFKWDDELLDYWRYGPVREFVIDEPALRIGGAVQTNATADNGHRYTFDVDVNVINDIPFELDDWGVAIYTTSLDECTSEDRQYDIKSAEGNSQTFSFSIDVDDVMMDTESIPYEPIMNHFAVPYLKFDGQVYGIFDNAELINLMYAPIEASIKDIKLVDSSVDLNSAYVTYEISAVINAPQKVEKTYISCSNNSTSDCIFDYYNESTKLQEVTYTMIIDVDLVDVRFSSNNYVINKQIQGVNIYSEEYGRLVSNDYSFEIDISDAFDVCVYCVHTSYCDEGEYDLEFYINKNGSLFYTGTDWIDTIRMIDVGVSTNFDEMHICCCNTEDRDCIAPNIPSYNFCVNPVPPEVQYTSARGYYVRLEEQLEPGPEFTHCCIYYLYAILYHVEILMKNGDRLVANGSVT